MILKKLKMNEEESNFTKNGSKITMDEKTIKIDFEQCNKDEIIEKLTEQIYKRNILEKENHSLQVKLTTFISRSSEKDSFLMSSCSGEADEWAFRRILDSITTTEDESQKVSINSLAEIESRKREITQKKESLMELETSFREATEKAALHSVNSETGECFTIQEVKELLAREEKASKTLQEYQLYSIQKRHLLNLALEKKKNLAQGPIDFAEYEMMCIETQNNKEVIHPMSEEIKNIKEKASNIVNILSHLGQKLHLAQKEKIKAATIEKEMETELKTMKGELFVDKMKYTKMKEESKELQHKFILLQYPKLIEDYNEVQQKNEEARKELQQLKSTYEREMKLLNIK